MANLSAPQTDLQATSSRSSGDAARIVAPISKVNAQLFSDMATTFEAISRDEQALKDTISENVPTLRVGTRSLRVQRPFLDETAAFSPRPALRGLGPARRRCPTSTRRCRSARR